MNNNIDKENIEIDKVHIRSVSHNIQDYNSTGNKEKPFKKIYNQKPVIADSNEKDKEKRYINYKHYDFNIKSIKNPNFPITHSILEKERMLKNRNTSSISAIDSNLFFYSNS